MHQDIAMTLTDKRSIELVVVTQVVNSRFKNSDLLTATFLRGGVIWPYQYFLRAEIPRIVCSLLVLSAVQSSEIVDVNCHVPAVL